MQQPIRVLAAIMLLWCVVMAKAQGTFQNLNFELANPGSLTFAASIPVTSALSDWTVTIGGVQQTDVGYNAFSTGASAVSLIGPGGPTPAIDGNFSVLLTGSSSTVSISQTGLIPAGTKSLFFDAEQGFGAGAGGELEVLIGTQAVAVTLVASESTYALYGANGSGWAGDTEGLTFSALEATSGLNNWTIDDISFSPQAVPEPNTLELIFTGGMMFGLYGWRKRGNVKPTL
jgi:hypothetical protein